MDDSEALRELGKRLDHIEEYLGQLGRVCGYRYSPYPGGIAAGSFDSAPASFGSFSGFSDGGPAGFSGDIPVGQPASQPGLIGGVPADLVMLARSKPIEAVRQYRIRSGLSLRDAKAQIDAALRQA
jgi:hypothetical protein